MPTPAQKTTASPLSLGQGISVKTGTAQEVQIVNPAPGQTTAAATKPGGPRPGIPGSTGTASAPTVLDFSQTNVLLKDLPEKEFRELIVKVQSQLDDLGLNRGNNADDYVRLNPRAEAYLDVVTWDPANRTQYQDSSSTKQSSCGMFVRDLWWLCGVRGGKLMDNAYPGSGIIIDLLHMAPGLRITYDPQGKVKPNWSTDLFVPQPGDVLYLYREETNKVTGEKYGSNHIFSIMSIDKDIAIEGGKAMIRNRDDGQPADTITFVSIDGGQADGDGQDSKHLMHSKAHEPAPEKRGSWGCHATKVCTRVMKLKQGRWPSITSGWPFPNGENGRPILAWVPIVSMQAQFTAPLVMPIRNSRPAHAGAAAAGTGTASAGSETHAAAEDLPSKRKRWDSFVEQNQGRAMGDMLNVLASAGYREVLDVRNWYANPENPKKGIFGLRVQVAMDATLHRNEGPGAAWILNEAELAGISAAHSSDQYSLIKSTIGMANSSPNNA